MCQSTPYILSNRERTDTPALASEHGVKVVTFIETKSKEVDRDTGEAKIIRRPWTTTVFHISQTEAMSGGAR